MSKISVEGEFTGKIAEIGVIEDRFRKNDGSASIELKIDIESGEWAPIYLDISNDYIPKTVPAITRKQATYNTLLRLGWRGKEFAKLDEDLIGKPVEFYGKLSENGKYLNFYMSSTTPKAEKIADAAPKLVDLFAGCEDDTGASAETPALNDDVFGGESDIPF